MKWFGRWGGDPDWCIEPSRLASDLICFFYLEEGSCTPEINGVEVPLKPDLPGLSEIRAQLAETPAGFAYERLVRQLRVRESVGDGPDSTERVWSWKLGAGALVGVPFEAYSILQRELRAECPHRLVLNLANGNHGYLPPAPLYRGPSIYTVWQTPYAEGGLETVTCLAKESLTPVPIRVNSSN